MSQPMTRAARRLGPAVALALALAASATTAGANPAAAQALFDQAKKLMAEGKHAEACPKLEESQRLDPGMGTQFNLASCYEQIGKTASAWSLFLEVAGAAKAANQPDREKVARQRAAALEPKLMRLTIAVPEDAPEDLQVTRDGLPVGKAQWGTPVPVDPGPHKVAARGSGMPAFEVTIELKEPGAAETITVDESGQAAAPPVRPLGPDEPTAPPEPLKKRNSTAMMVTGIVLTSLGVLAAAGGGVVLATCSADAERRSESNALDCDRVKAPSAGILIGGIAGIAVGIPLTIVGARKVPVERSSAASAGPTLFVGPGSAALRWSL